MLKKSLIGLVVVALAGGGYWYYDDYQKKEKVRLIKERNEQIARDLERMKEERIQEAIKAKERKLKEIEEERARQERIASGNPNIEEITKYYPWVKPQQKREQYTLVEGEKEGVANTWYENGQMKESMNYKNGELNGEYKYWKPSGGLYRESYYTNGQLDGKSISYSEQEESNYKLGRLHGKLRKWDNDIDRNTTYEAYYEHGLLEGDAYAWSGDRVIAHYVYKNNKLLKLERFYPTGEKRSLETYIPEEDIIQSIHWYKSGEKSFEGHKKQYARSKTDLLPAGTYHYYFPSGQKSLVLPYIDRHDSNGFRFGTCYRWDDTGKLIAQVDIDDHKDWTKAYKVIRGTKEDCRLTDEEKRIGLGKY